MRIYIIHIYVYKRGPTVFKMGYVLIHVFMTAGFAARNSFLLLGKKSP